ncbi:ABC transporter substrate-binding protein [Fimbriimonas ginsengisoli]|uniref:Extracellular solute-binding protein family 1 n=1 Tax=Fimbriimonas ginsengisoli Gsoil 348 TaxID=661478 RepID=A0A068NM59_FIMGI|nr:sugar ABC transporter substrate-binding protein [Fimbriimonas ginsengisoli]AIE84541.1 Extracellular solute-binding protein family 1 [Fimbriimonas ginsengisoli Gsoil 348]
MPLLLAGCASRPADGRIVIRVANWGGAKEGNDYDKLVEKIYRDFERENPGVEVREESVPGEYVAKMTLAFIAKAEPDILMLDASSSALFINSKMVADLTPLIEGDKSFRLSDYYPNVVDIDRRGKALYAIPQDFTPMVVYYNKRLFDNAHLPYPTSDWSFQQFREIAKKLTIAGDKPDDPPKQYGFAFTNWPAGWVMWLWNNGADHIAPDGSRATGYLDSPKAVEAVAYLRDLVAIDKSAPSISQTAALGVDPFANGQAAMAISGHWSLVGYKAAPKGPDGKPKITWDDLGVAPLPHQIAQSQTVMYESGYAIGAHSTHKEMAWKFIKYMTSHRVQSVYQSSGIAVCGRKDVAEERARSSKLEAAFIPIVPSARAPYGSRIEGYESVEDQMQKAMDSVLRGAKSPQAALTDAAQRIDREFAKR